MPCGRPSAAIVILLLVGLAPRAVSGAAPAQTRQQPLLWRVEKGGRVSHLFGTVHADIGLETALLEPGLAALDRAKRVYVELDLTSIDTVFAFLLGVVARAQLPPDRSLRTLVEAEAWDRLTKLHKGRVSADELDRLEPWFIDLYTLPYVLAPRDKVKRTRRRGGDILDNEIAERAKKRGAKVIPLESPSEHLSVFSAIGRQEALGMLEEIIADPEGMRDESDRLVEAYRAGDDKHLRKVIGRLVRRKPTVAEYLLFRRNERWRDRLVLWFPDGDVFVAVGAGHMFEHRGLVELLRERGYRVERVRAPAPR